MNYTKGLKKSSSVCPFSLKFIWVGIGRLIYLIFNLNAKIPQNTLPHVCRQHTVIP